MEVIAHQAPGVDLPIRLGTSLPQSFQKQFAISIVEENILAMITPIHEVVNGACKLNSKLSGHPIRVVDAADLSILRTDPFWATPFRLGQLRQSDRAAVLRCSCIRVSLFSPGWVAESQKQQGECDLEEASVSYAEESGFHSHVGFSRRLIRFGREYTSFSETLCIYKSVDGLSAL
jgi:hypothetical protein